MNRDESQGKNASLKRKTLHYTIVNLTKQTKQQNKTMKPIGLFHTPKNMEELQKYLSLFNKNEATIANTCAWMAWNLACKIANEEKTAQTTSLEIEVKGECLEKGDSILLNSRWEKVIETYELKTIPNKIVVVTDHSPWRNPSVLFKNELIKTIKTQ
jgi:phenylacetate-coenzyme A ligase PaaK-like adenylate-forming protein